MKGNLYAPSPATVQWRAYAGMTTVAWLSSIDMKNASIDSSANSLSDTIY